MYQQRNYGGGYHGNQPQYQNQKQNKRTVGDHYQEILDTKQVLQHVAEDVPIFEIWAKGLLQYIKIDFVPSKDQLAIMQDHFSYTTQPIINKPPYSNNPHALSAWMRKYLEEFNHVSFSYLRPQRQIDQSLHMTRARVIDIGGNPFRNALYQRDYVHTVAPILSKEDQRRKQSQYIASVNRPQQLQLQQCECVATIAGQFRQLNNLNLMCPHVDQHLLNHDGLVVYSCTDSDYYPGVLETMFRQITERPNTVGRIVRHVFPHEELSYSAIQGLQGYEIDVTTNIQEHIVANRVTSQFRKITREQFALMNNQQAFYRLVQTLMVKMKVNGNADAYEHPVGYFDANNIDKSSVVVSIFNPNYDVLVDMTSKVKFGRGYYCAFNVSRVTKQEDAITIDQFMYPQFEKTEDKNVQLKHNRIQYVRNEYRQFLIDIAYGELQKPFKKHEEQVDSLSEEMKRIDVQLKLIELEAKQKKEPEKPLILSRKEKLDQTYADEPKLSQVEMLDFISLIDKENGKMKFGLSEELTGYRDVCLYQGKIYYNAGVIDGQQTYSYKKQKFNLDAGVVAQLLHASMTNKYSVTTPHKLAVQWLNKKHPDKAENAAVILQTILCAQFAVSLGAAIAASVHLNIENDQNIKFYKNVQDGLAKYRNVAPWYIKYIVFILVMLTFGHYICSNFFTTSQYSPIFIIWEVLKIFLDYLLPQTIPLVIILRLVYQRREPDIYQGILLAMIIFFCAVCSYGFSCLDFMGVSALSPNYVTPFDFSVLLFILSIQVLVYNGFMLSQQWCKLTMWLMRKVIIFINIALVLYGLYIGKIAESIAMSIILDVLVYIDVKYYEAMEAQRVLYGYIAYGLLLIAMVITCGNWWQNMQLIPMILEQDQVLIMAYSYFLFFYKTFGLMFAFTIARKWNMKSVGIFIVALLYDVYQFNLKHMQGTFRIGLPEAQAWSGGLIESNEVGAMMMVLLLITVALYVSHDRKIFKGRVIERSCIDPSHYSKLCNDFDQSVKVKYMCPSFENCQDTKDHSCIKCQPTVDTPIYQKCPIIEGYLTPVPLAFHKCNKVIRAAIQRQTAITPKPDPQVLSLFQLFYQDIIMPWIMQMMSQGGFTYLQEEWLQHLKGPKKLAAIKELDNIEMEYYKYHYTQAPKLNEKNFVKMERIGDQINVKLPRPRNITAPCEFSKAIGGPFIYSIDKIFTEYDSSYCGGKNWNELSEYIYENTCKINDPIIFTGDGSSFDSTQHASIQKITDVAVYNMIMDHYSYDLPHIQKLKFVFGNLRQNVTVMSNEKELLMKYDILGQTPSGKVNTKEGNTRRMSCYFKFVIYLINQRYPNLMKQGINYFGLHCGDDVIFWLSRSLQKIFDGFLNFVFTEASEGEHGLGQILRERSYRELDDFDFCSLNGFIRNGRYRFIRVPARFFQLTPYTISITSGDITKQAKSFCYQEGCNILAWAQGLPIFEEYGHMMIRLGNLGKYTEEHQTTYERVYENVDGDYETCLSWMEKKFNVTRMDVDEIEDWCKTAKWGDVLVHEAVDRFFGLC